MPRARRAARGSTPRVASAERQLGRLAVDQVARLARRWCWPPWRRRCPAPRRPRTPGRRASRRRRAAARRPPPARRECPWRRRRRGRSSTPSSTRLGKNGGTQSKCVEKTSSRLADRGDDVDAIAIERLLEHRVAAVAQVAGQHARRPRPPARSSTRCRRACAPAPTRSTGSTASSSVRVSVLSSRYLTITGVASDRPHSLPAPTVTDARAGHDHRALGHHQRLARLRLDDAAVRQVVDRRRSGEHRAGGDHRAPLDHRALVDAGVAADQHVVLDDHRHRADRLDDAADLRAGAEVHAGADLRARSDQRVRVDQRAVADVGADVDVHRRHADDALADDTRPRAPTIRRARCGRRRAAPGRFSGIVSLS